eukprot:4289608-Alexandrium_andersonii.AAC.1
MNIDEQRGQKTKERDFEAGSTKGNERATGSQENPATSTADTNLQILHAMQHMMERMASLEIR